MLSRFFRPIRSISNHSRKEFKASRLLRDLEIANLRGATSRKVYRHNFIANLIKKDPTIAMDIESLRQAVREQGDLIRNLKQNNAPKVDIDVAVQLLKDKKKALEAKEASLVPNEKFVDRTRLEEVIRRKYFYDLSFSIYGGVSGLFSYGPAGVDLKENIISQWKSHFILKERLLRVEGTLLTPERVLEASGHVERFADLMVRDTKTNECYRLDHLIQGHLKKLLSKKTDKGPEIEKILSRLDGLTKDELDEVVRKFEIKAPVTDNELSEPLEFNLMFSTSIGPTGLAKAYLRPETAQGIFVDFRKLLDQSQGSLPFGVAQIGKSFRNEISPRMGLIRQREFTMAEIEYFVDPENKKHAKYHAIKDLKLNLYSADNQMNGENAKFISLEEAVNSGIVANEVLAYFLGRIYLFMLKIGVDSDKMRFRQHMGNEMAHYATDCWDCETFTSYGWLECVGCADRSCYDLQQHAKATKVKLSTKIQNASSKEVEDVVPHVIEPSFGIDRILYSVLEHNFKIREENSLRTFFSYPAVVAPIKCSVLPLSNRAEFRPFVDEIQDNLELQNVYCNVDKSSASIGKRYARADELGTPYGITIDFDTLQNRTVTLRHCITMQQIRVDVDSIAELVRDLTEERTDWDSAKKLWPEFIGPSE